VHQLQSSEGESSTVDCSTATMLVIEKNKFLIFHPVLGVLFDALLVLF